MFFRRRSDPITEAAQAALSAHLPPGATLERRDSDTLELRSAAGARVVCSLDSLRAEWPGDETAQQALLAAHVSAWIAMITPLPAQLDAARLLPVLKPAGWARAATSNPAEQPITFDCVAGIEALVVEELPGRLRFVSMRLAEASETDPLRVLAAALRNLDALVVDVEIEESEDDGPFMACLPGRYSFNAALVLSPEFWARAERQCGGPVQISVPDREFCLFASISDVPRVARMRELAESCHAHGGYPVSPTLLERDSFRNLLRRS